MNKQKKNVVKTITLVCIIVLGILTACNAYLNDFYHADMDSIEAFVTEQPVEMKLGENDMLSFEPEDADTGFIFYPGGLVEPAI